MPSVALKVDVATFIGARDGVPKLLELFAQYGVRATFYFAMGPDNSGKGIRRILTHPGYLRRLVRLWSVRPPAMRLFLYGTILPAPLIAGKVPEILRRTEAQGHEVGIHAWDHEKWVDLLPWLPKQITLLELGRACALFEEVMGRRARTTAAPGWQVSADSLEIQDALGLDFCSDARGKAPFFPVIEGRRFSTVQIPTTMPSMDELIVGERCPLGRLAERCYTLLRPGWNVLTVRAELEGLALHGALTSLLERLTASGVQFVSLGEIAAVSRTMASDSEIHWAEVPGCCRTVTIQIC